jgi:hypothetical protein
MRRSFRPAPLPAGRRGVIGLALLRIGQHFVRFLDLPVHILSDAIARVDAGVISPGQAPIRTFDFIDRRGSI